MTYYQKIWEEKIGFKNYKTTIEYVTRFLESKNPEKNTDIFPSKDVYLSQVNLEFITELEYYIRLGKHIQRLLYTS
jgi:hypothetical protein